MIEGKTFCFDIDGTICRTQDGDYYGAKPIKSRINKINNLYKKNKIIYFTSRGYLTGLDWSAVTKKQFKEWGVKCHEVIFGKPFAHYYIDNNAINDKLFFKK